MSKILMSKVNAEGERWTEPCDELPMPRRVYTKNETMAKLGIKYPAYINNLVTSGALEVVGYTPHKADSAVLMALIDADAVDEYDYNPRDASNGEHRFEIKVAPGKLHDLIDDLIALGNGADDEGWKTLTTIVGMLQNATDKTKEATAYHKERNAKKAAAKEGTGTTGRLTL